MPTYLAAIGGKGLLSKEKNQLCIVAGLRNNARITVSITKQTVCLLCSIWRGMNNYAEHTGYLIHKTMALWWQRYCESRLHIYIDICNVLSHHCNCI